MTSSIPLLEFDAERKAIIEPENIIKLRDAPEHCVICFFREVIESVKQSVEAKPLPPFKSETGDLPMYIAQHKGQKFGILPSAVGAPMAVGLLEEVIARGARKFVVCGGAGVLDNTIASGDVIVPTSALRDEGTSYHYLPPSREVLPSASAVEAIIGTLDENNVQYVKGKTWTTDAFYRETRDKVKSRTEEGCIAVEMEAAAFFAVAQFRGVQLGQLLYGGDDVSGIEWDRRELGKKIPAREKLFWLSLEACLKL